MDKPVEKLTYTKPVLVEYGSVRNLTGGSRGSDADVGGGMRMRVMTMMMF